MNSVRAIPHGIEYLSIQKTERVNRLKQGLSSLFQAEGFQEIIPPLVDYAATFASTDRAGSDRGMEFRDGSGEHLAIRSDLTVQTLKFALTGRTGQPLPARFFYVQRILADHKAGSGRPREILQAGVEWIGYDAPDRFAHLFSLAARALESLGHPHRFLYGDARFVDHLLSLMPPSIRPAISDALYQKDIHLLRSLLDGAGASATVRDILTEAPLLIGDESVLPELERLCQSEPVLVDLVTQAHRASDLIYDFGMVRELSYYSGPVFEAYLYANNRKILSGGIYDGLGARFSAERVSAAGFALDLNEIIHLPEGSQER